MIKKENTKISKLSDYRAFCKHIIKPQKQTNTNIFFYNGM